MLRAGGEGNDRGWDGWVASPTQMWVWAISRSWWRTGKPGALQSMGSQRGGHNLMTEQQQRRYSKYGRHRSHMTRTVLSKELKCEEWVRRYSSKSPEAWRSNIYLWGLLVVWYGSSGGRNWVTNHNPRQAPSFIQTWVISSMKWKILKLACAGSKTACVKSQAQSPANSRH